MSRPGGKRARHWAVRREVVLSSGRSILGTFRKALGSIICAALACGASWARAAEETRVVAGARAKGQLPEALLTVAWLHEDRSVGLARESEDSANGGRVVTKPDLVYHQVRNLIALRAELGLYRDLSLFVELPFVVSDERELSFDRPDSCASATTATAGCLDETNATILRDGILPRGNTGYGLDATTGQRFKSPAPLVFRGPRRSGLEYFGVGLSWALMNQNRDETKPTWIVRFQPRFAVGEAMSFDPANADANHGVGPGYHQYVFSTSFSRRFDTFEPFLTAAYILPQATSSSPFSRYTLGTQGFGGPQHVAHLDLGTELKLYDNPKATQRVTFELRGSAELRFFGLAQGELWEPLSGRSDCAGAAVACRPGVDRDFSGDGSTDPHPGVTRSPSYAVFGGSAGLNVQAGRHFRLRTLGGLTREQEHFLTDGRSGAEAFDLPGRRYVVRDANGWHLRVDAAVPF
jgi:hypothetical protein